MKSWGFERRCSGLVDERERAREVAEQEGGGRWVEGRSGRKEEGITERS